MVDMLREMLGGYAPGANRLTVHDLGELIRRAGRKAGFVVQSEYRQPFSSNSAGEIDWVWLDQDLVVAAFEIEGQNAAPKSLVADYEKFREIGNCLKFVALYSVSSKLTAQGMPPGGMKPNQWIAQNWPVADMPGVQVLLDTQLMATDGIEAIQLLATGAGLSHTRSIQARCAAPAFLVDRLRTLAVYFVECVEEGFVANSNACDALLHPWRERPRSDWPRLKSVVLAAPEAPVAAVATWIARDWFANHCAIANVSLADVASACEPFERSFAALDDDKKLPMRAAVRAVRYLSVRRRAGLGAHTRSFEYFIPDKYVPVGKVAGEGEARRREHVVPLKVLLDRCNQMLGTGASEPEVAEWLLRHLAIVEITKKQAHALDYMHGWKTCMPPNWEFDSGCIYERLHGAKFEFTADPAAPCSCAT